MFFQSLLLAALLGYGFALPTDQIPLQVESLGGHDGPHGQVGTRNRDLKGRFLHITDFHPDRFYRAYSSTSKEAACHRGHGPAGVFGAETSDCDTPTTLVNATFQWINDNLKDDIDFVIWTGDSARHDTDGKNPRTRKEVLELNTMLVDKFTEVFGKEVSKNDENPTNEMIIPIIPNFGNNDILPHNIMFPGPNTWTKHFASVWKKFIPEEQRHAFERGGWFYVEVIPHQLAVFSLNTLYFFDSNSAVDGCAKKSEPGYEQMDWLRIQLQFLRERGMKAIIIGHVPPARTESKQSWDETCWQKYALWMQQYRDVVVGSSYGHMNIDHFMLQDFKDIKKKTRKGGKIHVAKHARVALNDDTLTAETKSEYLSELRTDWSQIPDRPKSKRKLQSEHCQGFFCDLVDYVNELRAEWARIPAPPDADAKTSSLACMGRLYDMLQSMTSRSRKHKQKHKQSKEDKYLETIGGPWGENYAVSLVSPSVVPNYFPTIRVIHYNISGVENNLQKLSEGLPNLKAELTSINTNHNDDDDDNDDENIVEDASRRKSHHKKKKKNKKNKKPKFIVPLPPSKNAPPGPAYSPQPFTWLGYTQYFANLTRINNDFPSAPETDVSEEEKHEQEQEQEQEQDDDDDTYHTTSRWREGKHSGKHPHHPSNPKPGRGNVTFTYEVEYDTRTDTVWGLDDMTVRSYLDLARRIARYHPPSSEADESGEGQLEISSNEEKDDEELEEEGFGDLKKGHKKKKKGKKGKKHRKGHKGKKGRIINEVWFTFVRRAFVGAVGDEDLKGEFGRG